MDEVLYRGYIGRIGCHDGNKTYVVPVSYTFDGVRIIAHSKEGMKLKIMRDHPDVCFEVDEMDNMANWKSVICWGRFIEFTEEAERIKIKEFLAQRPLPLIVSSTVKLNDAWPFGSIRPANDSVYYSIHIDQKTGRFEQDDVTAYYTM